MKKTHLAIALLGAFAGVASAQSNVTVFGLLDVNITHQKGGSNSNATATASVPSRTAMEDGTVNGLNGSRWGIRTTDDLGGGVTAGVWLESGFGVDTGSSFQGGRLFGRQIFVFIDSKSFGTLRFGRQYVFADVVIPPGNPFSNALVFNPTTSVTNNGRNVATMLDAPRADNMILYRTPSLGGFWAGVEYAPDENVNDDFIGFAAGYAQGPITLGLAYEYNDRRVTVAGQPDKVNKSLSFGGKYDFGVVRLVGNYQTVDDVGVSANGHSQVSQLLVGKGSQTITIRDQNGYAVGVEVPVGAATFGAMYTNMKYEGTPSAAGLPSSYTIGKVALGVKYDVSRRTFLYAAGSSATGDLKEYITAKTQFQAGIQHRF